MPVVFLLFFLLMPAFAHAQAPDTSYIDTDADGQIKVLSYPNGLSIGHYIQSGYLATIYHTGTFNGCGVPVGTDSLFYNKPGKTLWIAIHYEHYKSKTPNAGCHATWTVTTTTMYDDGGRRKSVWQEKSGYETRPCRCGTYTTYNASGKIIRTESYPDCTVQKLECPEESGD